MAADPSMMDTRTTRAGTGIGIAVAIVATVGVLAFLAPRLREEMRDDIFSGPAPAPAAATGVVRDPGPAAAIAAAPAATVPGPHLAVARSLEPVPAGSLAVGESEVSAPAAAPPVHGARKVSHKHRAVAARAGKPRHAAHPPQPALENARYTGEDAPPRPAVRAPLRAYRERSAAQAARDERDWRRAPREDPWDYRTWREHRNTDAPSPSPLGHQPG